MNKILLILPFLIISCSLFQPESQKKYNSAVDKAQNYLDRYSNKGIDRKAEYHFINGLTEQQKGNWAESTIDFNLALEHDSSASIYYSLAKSYSKIGRFELSLESLLLSIEMNDEFVPAMSLLSDMYVSLNDMTNAIVVQERIVEIDDNIDNKLKLAQLLEYNDKARSIELYQDLYEKTADKYILRKLSYLYDPEDQNENYISTLEELYQTNPGDSKIAYDLLEIYLTNDNTNKIDDLVENVDSYFPNQELSKFYGSIAYHYLNDTSSVDTSSIANLLSKIDNRFNLDWRINMICGFLETRIDNWEKSIDWFNTSLKVSDENPDIPLQMGIHYLNFEKYSLADQLFSTAIDFYPENIELIFYKGIANSFENKKQSIIDFHRVLQKDSNHVESLIQLGVIYDSYGNLDSLSYYYNRALEIDSNNALACNNYAYSLAVKGIDLEKANSLSRKALDLQPDNSAYLDTYAWVHYKMGNYNEALDYLKKALEHSYPSAELFEHLGDIQKKLGNINDAIEAYKKALELEPERSGIASKLNGISK